MERQGVEVIKDLFLSILILAAIVSILAVIFYDKISLSKVIPETEEYALTEEMKKELESTKLDNAQEIVINYYIDSSDLKKYEKNNEYVKGRNNPFANVEDKKEENNVTDENNTLDGNNTSSGNNTADNFYPDDGTK